MSERTADGDEALLAASPLFDAAWYLARYPDAVPAGAVAHYLESGWREGRPASEAFHSAAYVALHPDVAQSGRNPLVHYLRAGRHEGRSAISIAALPSVGFDADMTPEEEAAIALVSASPLFDREWYLSRYPEVARSGRDPSLYFVRHAAAASHDPGPYFDTLRYTLNNPPLPSLGNTLVHYLRRGRYDGFRIYPGRDRRASPLFPEAGRSEGDSRNDAPWQAPAASHPMNGKRDAIVARPGSVGPGPVPWVPHAGLAVGEGETGILVGDTLLTVFGGPVVQEAVDTLTAFCVLLGIDPGKALRALARDGSAAPLPRSEAAGAKALSPDFTGGITTLCDAWVVGDAMRLRFANDAAEAAAHEPCVVRGFQIDAARPASPTLVGEGLVPALGPGLVDLRLGNPLLPVLLVLCEPGGRTLGVGLLPFPSLCRGGLHHAELLGEATRRTPVADLVARSHALLRGLLGWEGAPPPALAGIDVQLEGATGTERIFSPGILEWLARVAGLRVAALGGGPGETPTPHEEHLRQTLSSSGADARETLRGEAGARLILPPDALPTLAVLAARDLDPTDGAPTVAGSFLVTDSVSLEPRWSVTMPPLGEEILALQPCHGPTALPALSRTRVPSSSSTTLVTRDEPVPLAVRFQVTQAAHGAQPIIHRAPDVPGPVLRRRADENAPVTALVDCADPARLARFLHSLAQQSYEGDVDVVAVARRATDVERVRQVLDHSFSGCSEVRTPSELGSDGGIAARVRGRFVLLAADAIVLQDERTLSTLVAMAQTDRVASAGCVVLRDGKTKKRRSLAFQSGGFFPSHVSFLAAPRLILQEPNCLGALPNATYPVIANSFSLALVPKGRLSAFEAHDAGDVFGHGADLAFALAALARGDRHLCTSAISAAAMTDGRPREDIDPVGPSAVPLKKWGDILGSVALLRELRG